MRRSVVQTVCGVAFAAALIAGCEAGGSNGSAGSESVAPSSVASVEAGDAGAAGKSGSASASGAAGEDGAAGGEAAPEQVSSAIEKATQASPIEFQSESAELTAEAQQGLEQIASAMQGNDVRIKVSTSAGYENADEAMALSEKRAQAIKSALEDYGVAADRIETEATGNETKQGVDALTTQISVA